MSWSKRIILLSAVSMLYTGALWMEYTTRSAREAEQKRSVPGKVAEPEVETKTPDEEKAKKKTAELPEQAKGTKKKTSLPKSSPSSVYIVKAGDTLWDIAKKFYQGPNADTIHGVQRIRGANPHLDKSRKLAVGTRLLVPLKLMKTAPECKRVPRSKGKHCLPLYHTVVLGDNLYNLARLYYHDSKKWLMISTANPGLDPCDLKEGTKIWIPLARGQ